MHLIAFLTPLRDYETLNSMRGLFRDTTVGQTLRFLTRRRIAAYPEDTPDFQLPASYT